ncbi:hypothetical protein SAMD00019534_051330 [Acytostelium subglobosum LB1]|uniref:hypothetical protein n=1 Tax=Acytostelium subglobosum LB1 TaxID=1410327 RepID=UPI0006450F5B|nr:hypothetical protein SAMD00019534_051330 [Acytostelium subglobosum LB1]GAM21958.1 hypothetical protein SAMD00019534_051330 [Acytostelium subglobosum LB1]|eukprot:XP_012755058.1 hypothetical protein SAMD00019534_051330 [Acytostelium subglobosum LB1]
MGSSPSKVEQQARTLQGLEQIIKDRNLALYYRKFLYDRFSNENLSFWLEAENYRLIDSEELRMKRSKEIYDKYFNSSSRYELNIDHIQRAYLQDRICTPTSDLFLPIQGSIRKILELDTIPLFSKSECYRMFIKRKGRSEFVFSGNERGRSTTVDEIEKLSMPRNSR